MSEKYNLNEWISNLIKDYINNSSNNSLGNNFHGKALEEPLIGFSRGSDPLYEMIKEHIGDFCKTPLEVFNSIYPEFKINSDELSVVSWAMPYSKIAINAHRNDVCYPSEVFIKARANGEKINSGLSKYLEETFKKEGYTSVAPARLANFKVIKNEKHGISSTWSEKHIAFVSGLGTFGLSGGLITKAGIAVRFGSIIVNLKAEPTERAYTKYNEYCLFYSKGICKKCAERCPSYSIGENGHNKFSCSKHIKEIVSEYTKDKFNTDVSPCGLCQTRVPCESRIPIA